MKVLFVADLHYTLKQYDWLLANVASFDVVMIGGDLLNLASELDIDLQIVVVEKYLRRISQKTRVLVCSGNHDGDCRNTADESVAQWIRESKSEGLFVDGDCVALPGALITICPWWDGPVTRAELERALTRDSQALRKRWIWIHHSPPSASPTCWTGRRDGGDHFLRQWIERFNPDLVLSGHIHNAPFIARGSWVDRIGKTWVFNPGRQIGDSPTHISLDFDAMTAEWTSLEGKSILHLTLPDG